MWKSYVAENIMQEYYRKKKQKEKKELQKFIRENCSKCKNKNTNLCHINRNIKNKYQCVFKEI